MATKIRLQRHGSKRKPFYKIVVADSRARRDGKFIEQLGTYNPTTIPASIELNLDRAVHWLQTGAEPTDTVNAILKYKGAVYKKHLLRGVKLGVVNADDVEAKFEEWLNAKSDKIDAHKSKADAAKLEQIRKSVEAPAKVVAVEEEVVEETPAEEKTEE